MAKQKHIPLFDDQLEVVNFLSDQELGAAVRAAMQFMRNGEECELPGCAGMLYQVLKAQFVRQQKDTANGATGGRPPKNETEFSKTKTPLLNSETPLENGETIEENVIERNGTEQNGERADKPPHSHFAPPTVDEVRGYCSEKGLHFDPQLFVDFYSANGWVQGKGKPLKDWQAAARLWETREKSNTGKVVDGCADEKILF